MKRGKQVMKRIFTKFLIAVCCVSVLVSVCAANLSVAALAVDAIPTGTPTVDGDIDGIWEYASNKIDIKTLNLGSEADNASGWARLMWDKDAVYVLGYISDKTVSNTVTGDPWETDGFEFFLNEQNKQVSDFKWIDQFRADRENRFSGMIAHIISTEAQYKRTFPGIQWASKAVEGTTDYVVEFKVPWKKIEAKAGTKIRIAFQINDDYNNDGTAEGIITSEVAETFNPAMLTEMKLVSTKAQAPKNETASKNEASSDGSSKTESNTQSETESASKPESTVEDSAENGNTANEDTVNDSAANTEKNEGNETVTTVTETVNQKLLNTVIFASVAAVVLVAIVCVTVIIIAYKKKN